MSYENHEPDARVVCLLSRQGVLDAVRHGLYVDPDSTVTFWLRSDDVNWDRLFTLDPEPVTDIDGTFVAARLDIARTRNVAVNNLKPVEVWFLDPEIRVWHHPTVEVQYGRQVPLDECAGVDALLDFEEQRRRDSLRELQARAEQDLPALLEQWRTWSVDDGLRYARELADRVVGVVADAKQLRIPQWWETTKLVDRLNGVIGIAEAEATDESFTELARVVDEVCGQVGDVQDRVERERRRRADLDEATNWVLSNGSQRLQKAVQAGLLDKSMGAYRDERLRVERPGWSWSPDPKIFKDIVNPGEDVIDSLLEARQIDPDVKLVFCPGSGASLASTFLSRYIIRAVPTAPLPYTDDEEPF